MKKLLVAMMTVSLLAIGSVYSVEQKLFGETIGEVDWAKQESAQRVARGEEMGSVKREKKFTRFIDDGKGGGLRKQLEQGQEVGRIDRNVGE